MLTALQLICAQKAFCFFDTLLLWIIFASNGKVIQFVIQFRNFFTFSQMADLWPLSNINKTLKQNILFCLGYLCVVKIQSIHSIRPTSLLFICEHGSLQQVPVFRNLANTSRLFACTNSNLKLNTETNMTVVIYSPTAHDKHYYLTISLYLVVWFRLFSDETLPKCRENCRDSCGVF